MEVFVLESEYGVEVFEKFQKARDRLEIYWNNEDHKNLEYDDIIDVESEYVSIIFEDEKQLTITKQKVQ